MEEFRILGAASRKRPALAPGLFLAGLAAMVVFAGCARTPKQPSEHEQISESLSLYETGLGLELENNLAGARAAYEQSLAVSGRPIVHYRLGVLLTRLGEYEEALKNLDRALELVPSLTVAEREKVRTQALMQMQARGETPVDLAPVEIVAEPEPPAPAPVKEAEEAPIVEEVSSEAPTAVPPAAPPEEPSPVTPEPAVAEAPAEPGDEPGETPPEVELALASGYDAARRGDLDAAVQIYEEALAVAPKERRLYYNLGNLYQRQEKYKEAYVKYQRALDLDPAYGRAWNNLGYVLERLSRSDEALDCYEQALASGGVVEAYYNSGLLLEKKGRLEEALERFREFLRQGGAGEQADTARQHIQRLERHF